MATEEATTIIGLQPGYYQVSPTEQFVNMSHDSIFAFGTENYQEVEREPAVYDVISRKTNKPEMGLLKWVNSENGIFLIIQDGKVIGKMHVVSLTSFNRNASGRTWFSDLRNRLGI